MAEKKPYTGKPRGFAAMDRSRVAEIAASGGRASQAKGVGFRWTTEQAREQGAAGGRASQAARKAGD